jgi:hypothetical protein
MLPKASVFWVNYNSIHVISIIKKSLDAIFQLDYPNFELIVVDNCSTDGSEEVIEEYVKSKAVSRLKVKLMRLSKNWGFAGGINFAYRARNRKSKYIAIVNNDAIPKPDYLRKLVIFLEEHQDIGAVQGIVTKLGENSIIDSAGCFLYEDLKGPPSLAGKPTRLLRKPMYVSYVEGTMPVYKVDAIRHALGDDNTMYITSGFMYYLEDVFLSLMLWSHDYKCIVLPTVTGEHYRMAAIRKFSESIRLPYYGARNYIALLCMTNSRDKARVILKYLRRIVLSKGGLAKRKMVLNVLIDGIRLGRELGGKYGIIDLYKAPILRTPLKERLHI